MAIGQSVPRIDAYDKATGRAKYTADLYPQSTLVAKILHSTIANGWVKRIDTTKAMQMEGVVKVITCFDVPQHAFPTPGHPWSTNKAHQDVADRHLLTSRVRMHGDDIAVVVAEDELVATQALELIEVEYEELAPILDPILAMQSKAESIHQEVSDNILKHTTYHIGDYEAGTKEEGICWFEDTFETQQVQHCHIENVLSYAYEEGGRIVIVSSTQIPHIVRRAVGQALGIPWGEIRVIKPYVGGGFGNKQDVLYEPLNAYICKAVGGRCVKLELSREETFFATRTRHAIRFKLKAGVRKDGTLVARKVEAIANQGAYASHGHAIVSNAINTYRHLYQDEKGVLADAYTVYTNCSTAGAMRGYGIPQAIFAYESHMQDIAVALDLDPIAFRQKNKMPQGYEDPLTGIKCYSNGLDECIKKGAKHIDWDNKYSKYQHQTGKVRRGVGMAIFSYKTGVYPIALETASCRLVLNQDGSLQLQAGATEIGQGTDTVLSQMAAETLGFSIRRIHVVSTQDTDITPFDTGAYASRQAYVSGRAVKEAAKLLKQKILKFSARFLGVAQDTLEIKEDMVIDQTTKEPMIAVERIALEAFYHPEYCEHLTAEYTAQCKENTFALGACFAEVEVDLELLQVKVVDIINVHDCGKVINPALATAQVHGGMSMGLGYALSEVLCYDHQGKMINPNLLDYKLPTSMDSPDLHVAFAECDDPSGPYGNKALGEPPAIPVAPAIRNAIYNATGVAFNTLPITPERLFEKFKEKGLI